MYVSEAGQFIEAQSFASSQGNLNRLVQFYGASHRFAERQHSTPRAFVGRGGPTGALTSKEVEKVPLDNLYITFPTIRKECLSYKRDAQIVIDFR